MVKHVVMFRFGAENKEEALKTAKEKLEGLRGKIDTLTSLEVGLNINNSEAAYDLVLITEHPDEKGLDAYQVHPAHQEVVAFIKQVAVARVVVDYNK
ncbi:MAG: Dabb family protein [Cytophagales bacterium]|nr:Dabb family protein [Cytophagales bacterium]